jgi:hypothetical protein
MMCYQARGAANLIDYSSARTVNAAHRFCRSEGASKKTAGIAWSDAGGGLLRIQLCLGV